MTIRAFGGGDIYFKGKVGKMPTDITRKISIRAAEIIKKTAPAGQHNSRARVRATNDMGMIGVYFPPEATHLIYLDRGIKPRLMTELKGKTIPIRTPGGIIFRRAKNVGMHVLSRDENGNLTKFKIAWSYPGVRAMNFIQPALKKAVDEWVASVKDDDMVDMLKGMGAEAQRFFSRLEKK